MFLKKPDRLIPYEIHSTFSIGPPGLLSRIQGTVGIPDFILEDFTGDGRRDFAVDSGRKLTIFPVGEDGRIVEKSVESIDLTPLEDSSGELPPIEIGDLNGDAKPDFIVSHRYEGITDIFLSGGDFTKPDHRVKIPEWAFPPRLSDLDGDGRVDLIIPSTPKVDNLATAMSVWATQSLSVSNRIFLNTGDPKTPFRKEPDEVREIRVDLRLYVDLTGNIQAEHSVLVEYRYDFNGDGRKDLLYREGADEIRVYYGQKDGVMGRDAAITVEIPDTKGYAALSSDIRDLNADGTPDVALFYESRNRGADRLVLLLSRK